METIEQNDALETKKLILDFSKWRCGGPQGYPHENVLGEGVTKMKNDQGFMCCLGQFSIQLNKQISESSLLGKYTPSDISKTLKIEIPLLSQATSESEEPDFADTELTNVAVEINDNTFSTPEKKIENLKRLFSGVGLELEVINKP